MTQRDRVLNWLEEKGSITAKDATDQLGVYRLSDVIFRLRNSGYNIESKPECSKNRYGEDTHYARYVLHREPVQLTMEV